MLKQVCWVQAYIPFIPLPAPSKIHVIMDFLTVYTILKNYKRCLHTAVILQTNCSCMHDFRFYYFKRNKCLITVGNK